MAKKQSRIPTSHDSEPLTDSPFARALGNMRETLPEKTEQRAPQKAEILPDAPPWSVARTRKGGWPLLVERRGGGKEVTVVDRVSGDTKSLLKALQKVCGAGGTHREAAVEIQGNHIAAITQFLDNNR